MERIDLSIDRKPTPTSFASALNDQETVFKPSTGLVPLNLGAIWKYRELLYFLTWRDLKVRYKQTFLGIAWVVLQPFLLMTVFSVFFGFLARIPSEGVPYPIFVFCGLIPWQLVSSSFTDASNSLSANQNLIRKVYFPRVIIPLSAIFARLVDFVFALLVLIAMMFYYDLFPGRALSLLPVFVLLALAIGSGVGLWLSALTVRYRDVRHMIPFLTQLWFFLSPIAYPVSLVPESWRFLYSLNPMVAVVEGFRWALLNKDASLESSVAMPAAVAIFFLVGGLYYFQSAEKTVADVV